MRKALLLARHDIIGQYSERTALMRALLFSALPIVIVLLNRRSAAGRGSGDILIVILGLYAALLPSASAAITAAASFAGEKEAQTLIPLLAAPIRDLDIVAGKLMATVVPSAALSLASVLVFDVAARATYGADRVSRLLPPAMLTAFVVLGVFFVLTLGSWVMVLSARMSTQRGAQQLAGFVIAGTFVSLSALGTLIGSNITSDVVLVAFAAVTLSDLVALELVRRLWDREEAVARL